MKLKLLQTWNHEFASPELLHHCVIMSRLKNKFLEEL